MNLLSKFPSYDIVIKGAMATFKRYPFTLISAIFGTIVSVELADTLGEDSNHLLERLQIVCALGLPLFVALVHFAEKQHWQKYKNLALQVAGAVLLGLYYFSLPQDITGPYIYYVRFLLLGIGLHFLVAVLPFATGKQVQGFWQYNKSLFLRFLLAALYSGVLYIGLMIALAAADHLFGFEVKEIRYFQMWIIIVGIFNTWVFLAGIPKSLDNLRETIEYPKGLKVFTQYILLPLVALYFVILISYEAKIIIQWNWPKGWVSHLVLWYAVVGILSSLLLHPLREQAGNRWIQVFTKWFYRALVPLVVLLFLAIAQRLSDYGVTENRYFVLAMAVGLSIVVIYFIFSKAKDIRIIPGILCLIALLAAYGPWSAFSVSKSNQQGRLETFMETYNILVDDSVQKAPGTIPFEERKQMCSIISYLVEWHGLQSFSGWLSDSSLASVDTVYSYLQDREITKVMGFEWVSRYDKLDDARFFNGKRRMDESYEIAGYEHLVEVVLDTEEKVVKVNDIPVSVNYDPERRLVRILLGDTESSDNVVEIPLEEGISEIIGYRTVTLDADQMTFSGECATFDARMVFESISGYNKGDSLSIDGLRADLLLRLK